jgi:hypothetical protein
MVIRLESLGRLLARLVLERVVMRQAWIAAALLAGCVPSRSGVFGLVDRDAQRRIGFGDTWSEEGQTSAAIDALLTRPLDLDAAVRIAFARNHRLQARSNLPPRSRWRSTT